MAALYALGGAAQSDEQVWVLREPTSGTTVPISGVSFLLASDWSDTFSIVCDNGTSVSGVSSVNVVKATPSGIASTGAEAAGPQIVGSARERLTLAGCKAGTHIGIYDAAGRMAKECVADGGTTAIDVARLTPGIYVLKAGQTAIKFIKK